MCSVIWPAIWVSVMNHHVLEYLHLHARNNFLEFAIKEWHLKYSCFFCSSVYIVIEIADEWVGFRYGWVWLHAISFLLYLETGMFIETSGGQGNTPISTGDQLHKWFQSGESTTSVQNRYIWFWLKTATATVNDVIRITSHQNDIDWENMEFAPDVLFAA